MRYRLRIDRLVAREIDRLPGSVRQRILRQIDDLLDNPRPTAAKQLRHPHADKWQIPIDSWRLVYRIDDMIVIVEVLRIGKKHGPEFYEDLE